jgi:hypothetical protein
MAGAEARLDLIGFIGTTEVVPCYKAMLIGVFHQADGRGYTAAPVLFSL